MDPFYSYSHLYSVLIISTLSPLVLLLTPCSALLVLFYVHICRNFLVAQEFHCRSLQEPVRGYYRGIGTLLVTIL